MNKKNDFDYFLKKQLKNRKVKKYYNEYGKQLELVYRITEIKVAKAFRVEFL